MKPRPTASGNTATKAIAALKRALGPILDLRPEALHLAGLDNARLVFRPTAIIRARNHEDVSSTLRLANRYGIPVTARGAGSATTGAASASDGGWALDLCDLNKIAIDAASGMAHVGAGAITEKINTAAEAQGWFYPPDPSSKKHSTIGGNLATNAGGLRGAKYGVTRDYVLALEGVLPTGEFVRWGAPLRKFASGYNLRDLWIGSEGTLGVITAATLRLIPKPETRQTFLFGFKTDVQALRAAQALIAARLIPSIMEFLDRQTVTCTLNKRQNLPSADRKNPALDAVLRHFSRPPALLLVELDGPAAVVKAETRRLRQLLPPASIPSRAARSEAEAEALWQIRRTCSQAMFQMGDTKLNEDIVVPIQSYLPLLAYTLQLKKETGLATPTFGHAADGNFHVHLMYNHQDPDQCSQAEQGVQRLMEKVIELDGAITGEHGIGLAKSPFLHLQHSPDEIAAMRRIKQALDPQNILNPDKIFTPFSLWEHPRDRQILFPWDKKH